MAPAELAGRSTPTASWPLAMRPNRREAARLAASRRRLVRAVPSESVTAGADRSRLAVRSQARGRVSKVSE